MSDSWLPRSVLFVHAHPDDETISTGGTIAQLVQEGVRVSVLTCTRGELGEVVPEGLKHLTGNPNALAKEREKELASALKILGVTDHRFLGSEGARAAGETPRHYLDSGMRWKRGKAVPVENLDERAFCAADFDEVLADFRAALQEIAPEVVISYDSNGGYGHPDHVLAADLSSYAAGLAEIPCFEIVRNPKGKTAVSSLDVSDVIELKKKALAQYKTQLTVKGNLIVHSGGQEEEISTVESYRNRAESGSKTADWSELGVWWKVTAGVILLFLGLIVGTIATINHQITIGKENWPLGVVLALSISALLLVGMRLYFNYLPLVICGAVGFIAPVIIFAQSNFSESVLIPFNKVGITWLVGASVLALGSVVIPRLSWLKRVSMGKGEPARKERQSP